LLINSKNNILSKVEQNILWLYTNVSEDMSQVRCFIKKSRTVVDLENRLTF
jgi:hypothetical protein